VIALKKRTASYSGSALGRNSLTEHGLLRAQKKEEKESHGVAQGRVNERGKEREKETLRSQPTEGASNVSITAVGKWLGGSLEGKRKGGRKRNTLPGKKKRLLLGQKTCAVDSSGEGQRRKMSWCLTMFKEKRVFLSSGVNKLGGGEEKGQAGNGSQKRKRG